MKQAARCEKLPRNMKFNTFTNKLECIEGYFDIKDQGCLDKPELMEYDERDRQFYCKRGYYEINRNCEKPGENEEYEAAIGKFTSG